MIDVLADIHLAEATLNIANDSISRLNDTTQLRIRFAQVFLKNDIDPDDFNASLTYYLGHIEELDNIYKEVINRLTALEATLQPKPDAGSRRINPDQKRMLMKNIWFRSMNKTDEPEAIQYFSIIKYPIAVKVVYPEPLR